MLDMQVWGFSKIRSLVLKTVSMIRQVRGIMLEQKVSQPWQSKGGFTCFPKNYLQLIPSQWRWDLKYLNQSPSIWLSDHAPLVLSPQYHHFVFALLSYLGTRHQVGEIHCERQMVPSKQIFYWNKYSAGGLLLSRREMRGSKVTTLKIN